MAKRISKPTSSKLAAKQWLKKGIAVVPIKKGTKKPDAGDDWQDLRIKASQVDEYFDESNGIGGLWGEPSNGIVDIDLDCKEAVRAARSVLPKTFRYGRDDNPGSHYLYTCVGAKTTKWVDPETREVLLELRSTGAQSLLPPTRHPSGDTFRVEKDLPFESIGARELTNVLGQIAAVSLAAKYYPEGGGRHDFIHAWTGSLLRTGMARDHVRTLCAALLVAVGDREDDRGQRERTVANTIDRHDDSKTAGWKTLGEFVPAKAIEKIKAWLKSKTNGHEGPVVVGKRTDDYEPIPDDLLDIDGVAKDIMRWSRESNYVKQPLFDLATALFLTAVSTRNRYLVGCWQTPLQPYFMLLAGTAQGKDSALNSVRTFCSERNMAMSLVNGYQSSHAMHDHLTQPPHHAILVMDEIARKLQSASRANGPDYQVITSLLMMHNQANKTVAGLPGRAAPLAPIEHPFINVIAATQPKTLIEAASGQDLTTGLFNRFILFDAPHGAPLNHQRMPELGALGKKWMGQIREASGGFYTIPMDVSVYKMTTKFADWCQQQANENPDDLYGQLWGRVNLHALQLAGILAVSRDPVRPRMTADVVDWGQRFMRWSTQRWMARLGGRIAEGHSSKLYMRIRDYIFNVEKYAHRAKSKTEAEMAAKGVMHHSLLLRVSNGVVKRDLEPVIEALVEAGEIVEGDDPHVYARV